MNIPSGVIVAMLTPFDESGRIDEVEVRKLVNFLIDKGVDGIFPVSSSGEYVHLDMEERKYLIDIVTDEAKSKADIIPGTGATCYSKSIELANYAKGKGCSGVVLSGPYFFKNSEEVVEGHLKKVAESVDIPIFLYNIPFFANEITPKIAEKLCSFPNVVGIKDSSGSMVNIMNLIEMTRKVNPDFRVLTGAEETFLAVLLMGGNGSMTAIAGIMPEFMVGIYNAYKNGNFQLAYNLQFAILSLIREMKSVNFPQGFKEALTTRNIKMGPPKMSYPSETLVKISELRVRLEMEMADLLDKYFPGTSLKYWEEYIGLTPKFKYPISFNQHDSEKIKKYEDCTMCGMCEGDKECVFTAAASSIGGINSIEANVKSNSKIDNISEKELKEIVMKAVKKILNQM